MFQKHKGNCYSFAAAYYYLAKNIGYNPREVAGLVGYNRRPHGWIEIDINGQTYIYDTELTMAKRRDGYTRSRVDDLQKCAVCLREEIDG